MILKIVVKTDDDIGDISSISDISFADDSLSDISSMMILKVHLVVNQMRI